MLKFGFSVDEHYAIKPIFHYTERFLDLDEHPKYLEYRSTNDERDLKELAYVIDGMRIRYAKLSFQEISELHIHNEQPFVQLRVNLNDQSVVYVEGDKPHVLKSQQYNLLFFPKGKQIIDRFPAGDEQEILRVDLQPHLFLKYCPALKSGFQFFREQVIESNFSVLSKNGLPLNTQMCEIIRDIISCRKSDLFRHIYLKVKIAELLLLQLEQFEQLRIGGRENTVMVLKEKELQRVQRVKEILENQYHLDHTLLSLARNVGTNDASLKKHFKQAFGVTVFSYLNEVRMLRAKALLLQENEKVAVVAGKVGYKHATHFSAAFKKYFGYLPTRIKLACVSCLFDVSALLSGIEMAFAPYA
ncbi:helix-turn-helix transcriptional regulator [Olivibacter sp. SDN3]|uniref:helix-turn-helix transcriptional regulator n=1 Tax=Olivibacter sp. SDN3 TaxID=2764720 RepID=UPI0016518B18|nr:AraC family transcriptional regulator [Olivibacter sp. SDN3]QNL49614.1 helix-turn-helix transcriptional regulator [Olivibacter sp. SDN3]